MTTCTFPAPSAPRPQTGSDHLPAHPVPYLFLALLTGLWVTMGGGTVSAAESAAPVVLGQPFWESSKMRDEPLLFIQAQGQSVATAKLLFVPRSPPRLTSGDLQTVYVDGKDYLWKPGTDVLERTSRSRIPFKTAAQMSPPRGSPHSLAGVLWSEGRYFHDLQVLATYQHNASLPWPPAWPQPLLTRSLARLRARQPFTIVALGDSITEGYNASGFAKVMAPPFEPPYPQLVANTLQQRFGARVALVNLAVAGTRAQWGLTRTDQVVAAKPDLVILAFGMNDNEPPPVFGATMRRLVAAVQAGVPQADIVLVAGMTGNPRIIPTARFIGYRDALRQLVRTNVALADVTTPWLDLLKHKPFTDLTGNGLNHPNDFGHRLYAQLICALFPARAGGK